jgi:hypothetical protein
MKGLTIPQPYASSVIKGRTSLVNMSWRLRLTRAFHVAIHADDRGNRRRLKPSQRNALANVFPDWQDHMVYAAVLGKARLVACLPYRHPRVRHNPLATGPYCWLFDRIDELPKPIKSSGGRGLWLVPKQISDALWQRNKPSPIVAKCDCGRAASVLVLGSPGTSQGCTHCHMLSCLGIPKESFNRSNNQ